MARSLSPLSGGRRARRRPLPVLAATLVAWLTAGGLVAAALAVLG